jgi:diguanylate cyclase (GGDEF)-like protein/PAS domain S-box-containing protein
VDLDPLQACTPSHSHLSSDGSTVAPLTKLRAPALLRSLMRRGRDSTGHESSLDRLSRLAARLVGTKIAAVTLLDETHHWVEAHVGLDDDHLVTPVGDSYCQFVVDRREVFVVTDSRTHHDVSALPATTSGSVGSYLGCPLILRDGEAVGALCVADVGPRAWSAAQVEILRELSVAAVAELELRAALAESARRTREAEEARRALEASQLSLRASEARFRRLADASFEGVGVSDGKTFLEVNRAMAELFGYTVEEMVGLDPTCCVAPEARPALEEARRSGADTYETVGLRRSGERFLLEVRVRIVEEHGRTIRITTARDVTAQNKTVRSLQEHADEMTSLSQLDELTGLSNRRGFLEQGRKLLAHAETGGAATPVVFFVDVNGMKRVNDELGHEEGDRLLRDVADLLRATFRSYDVLARLGGDEYAVVAACGEQGSAAVATRLQTKIERFNSRAVRSYRVSLSLGASIYRGGSSLEQLLAEADERMYGAKRASEEIRSYA